MKQQDVLRKQIGLVQQSIWQVQQARELFYQATCKDPDLYKEFNDLVESLECKLDQFNDKLSEIQGN